MAGHQRDRADRALGKFDPGGCAGPGPANGNPTFYPPTCSWNLHAGQSLNLTAPPAGAAWATGAITTTPMHVGDICNLGRSDHWLRPYRLRRRQHRQQAPRRQPDQRSAHPPSLTLAPRMSGSFARAMALGAGVISRYAGAHNRSHPPSSRPPCGGHSIRSPDRQRPRPVSTDRQWAGRRGRCLSV